VKVENRNSDRRIIRTRLALQQAFMNAIRDKGFTSTTVQDIAEYANVNRGTFYHHFATKYALADEVIRSQFHQQLSYTLPVTLKWDRQTLYSLIHAVLACLESKYQHRPYLLDPLAGIAPLFEQAVPEELAKLILMLLKESTIESPSGLKSADAHARVVSWAIFGSALQWSKEPRLLSSEEMTNTILLVITTGITGLNAE
jgi:AcrR family transcriptional regulator